MAVEVKRKKSESVESLLRRFQQRVMQSGVQYRARQVAWQEKPASKRKLKESALRRQTVRAKRKYLQRIGRLPLDDKKNSQSFSGRRRSVVK